MVWTRISGADSFAINNKREKKEKNKKSSWKICHHVHLKKIITSNKIEKLSSEFTD
jgi:hypothetical protein